MNTCTCANGTPPVATGFGATLCELNNTEDCSACKSGYHLSSPAALGLQTCLENTCTCPSGTATVGSGSDGTLCEIDTNVDCSSCNVGFHLTSIATLGFQTCVENVCTCPFGNATVGTGSGGTLCESHNTIDCSSCNFGYHLEANVGTGALAGWGRQTCTTTSAMYSNSQNIIPAPQSSCSLFNCTATNQGMSLHY